MTTKARRSLNLLHRNLSGCSRETKDKAYNTMVRPILEYAGAVWDPYQSNHIDMLEKVQCKAARFVCSDYSRYFSGSGMMSTLAWRSLQEIRFISRLGMFYQAHHHQTTYTIPPYIPMTQPRTRTSHDTQYLPTQVDIDTHKSFFP